MSSRDMNTLIALQRYTSTQDEYGEEVQTWASLGQEWCAIYFGRGDERRQAAAEQGTQAANFQMLANLTTLGLKIEDRIVLDGLVWDIVGISPHTPKRGLIEVTATATGQAAEVEAES